MDQRDQILLLERLLADGDSRTMNDFAILIAIRANNEYANSALPDAPVRPDPPRRRTLRRLIAVARRVHGGESPVISPGTASTAEAT
jgi:hypothetical protein